MVRANFEKLCATLLIEDYSVQPIDFVSPPKWHLAHTTWFWETFVLTRYVADYKVLMMIFLICSIVIIIMLEKEFYVPYEE
jgi:hypothetical protein